MFFDLDKVVGHPSFYFQLWQDKAIKQTQQNGTTTDTGKMESTSDDGAPNVNVDCGIAKAQAHRLPPELQALCASSAPDANTAAVRLAICCVRSVWHERRQSSVGEPCAAPL